MKPTANDLGSIVRYYLDGWRYGHLEAIKGKTVSIRPIPAFKAGTPRCITAALDEVEVEQKGKQCQP